MEFQVLDPRHTSQIIELIREEPDLLVGRRPPGEIAHSHIADHLTRTGEVLVAMEGERVMGFVWMEAINSVLFVQAILVTADAKRRGLGHELLVRAHQRAVKRGFQAVGLEVFPDNLPMIRLIGSMGFTLVENRGTRDYYELRIPDESFSWK